MWSRSVKLDACRVQAWWDEREGALSPLGKLKEHQLVPATMPQVGSLLGTDESVATGVYTSMHAHGVLTGLLFATSDRPATQLLRMASDAFVAFAAQEGCQMDEPWAIVDMRCTLAESLAAQTLSLDLVAIATAHGEDVTFAFVPNWRVWAHAGNMEERREAA